MKHIIKLFIAIIVVSICLTACDKEPYTYYVVRGRMIDKITREPVSGIFVSFSMYDIVHPQDSKNSPPETDSWSDENGEFRTLDRFSHSLLYVYGYGAYKDTTISVDFSNVSLSGTPYKNYKGDYILYIEDVELEKIISE
jgi:hypothetical protein